MKLQQYNLASPTRQSPTSFSMNMYGILGNHLDKTPQGPSFQKQKLVYDSLDVLRKKGLSVVSPITHERHKYIPDLEENKPKLINRDHRVHVIPSKQSRYFDIICNLKKNNTHSLPKIKA